MQPKKYTSWKIIMGLLLLIFAPRHFAAPNTPATIGYDLAGLVWWALVAWLLWTGLGLGERKPTE